MKLIKKYGGGSGSSTTVNTIPSYLQPYLTSGLSQANTALNAGQLSQVAGFTPEQVEAQQMAESGVTQQNALASSATSALTPLQTAQTTGYAIDPSVLESNPQLAAMKSAAIRSAQSSIQPGLATAAASGVSTGDRAAVVGAEQQADLAASLAGLDMQTLQQASTNAMQGATSEITATPTLQSATQTGANTLQSVGTAIQQQEQAEDNATYQGLSRYASLIQGTPWQSQQQTTQGGK